MTHRELCFDLAAAKATPYIEVPLEGVWFNRDYGKADVLTIKKSYTRFNLDIYECKTSKSDFNNEIKTGKYKKYFKYCHRLYFACLAGLATREEIPDNVGLIVRGKNGWKTIKPAVSVGADIPVETLMSILFYRSRVYSPNRERLSLWYADVDSTNKEKLRGFGRSIKKKILNYNELELKYRQLLYFMRNHFNLESEEEIQKYVNEKSWRF